MTVREFIDDITTFRELYTFCFDNDIEDFFYDRGIMPYDSFDDWVEEEYVRDLYDSWHWRDIYDSLSNIAYLTDSYDWFDISDPCELKGLRDDSTEFVELKQEVLDWAIDEMILDGLEDDDENDNDEPIEQVEQDTQVKWGVKVLKKNEEEEEEPPQDDMSLVMFF